MKITKANIRTWSMLGQRGTFFGVAMNDIAKEKENIKLLTADLSLLSGMDRFIKAYPEKFINVGIAEQNMIGIAAGLAISGDVVFATTYASFITVRSLEHIRQHMAHLKCNIKIVGSSAGVVASRSGISHWATEDIAFMRALPNIEVLSPADSLETIKMAHYATNTDNPVYIRLSGGLNCPIVYRNDYEFIKGKAVLLREGKDVLVIATGLMVEQSLKVAKILEEKKISCTVVNIHTIKPLDKEFLEEMYKNHKMIVTVEEHNIIGGLGSAIAEHKSTLTNMPKQVFIGFNDTYTDAGTQQYIWDKVGLTVEKIAKRIESEYRR